MRRLPIAFAVLAFACGCESGAAVGPPRGQPGPTAAATGALAATTTSEVPEVASAATPPPPPLEPATRLVPGGARAVRGEHGMVSSIEAHATRVGVDILARGGNAIDAAVAVGYALAVTNPQAGPLGGGGFMLIRLATGEAYAIDYREVAPKAAGPDALAKLERKGWHGYLSAPVPGVVAGLDLARERFGTLPLAELVAPAIKLAKEGHELGPRQAQVLAWHWDAVKKDPTMRAIFGKGDKPVAAGARLVQKSLAKTLERIARDGDAGFYGGEVAEQIDKAMKARGGFLSRDDLAAYRAVVREPLRFVYRGFEVLTMPPPSMGGIALLSIMRGLESLHAWEAPAGSARSLHLFAEAARRAYADRRAIAADPDFVDHAVVDRLRDKLLAPAYFGARTPAVDPEKATPSKEVVPIQKVAEPEPESPDTTHFSVVDALGNAVSCTTTLSAAFGAGVAIPGTGVIPSNAMGAFTRTGVNTVAPGKRMASSMTPLILVAAGKTVALLGSPGGDTIPNTVAQVLRNLVDYGMTIDEAIEAPRVHHQWLPDELRVEKARPPPIGVLAELEKMGHKVVRYILQGAADDILVDPDTGVAWGHADERQGGLALGPP